MKSDLCKYSKNCGIYRKALIEEKRGNEDAIEQIHDICRTDARFVESCYQSRSKLEKISS